MAERLLSTWQAAELLGITQSAVIGWIEKGRLPFQRLDNGAVRIREKGVLDVLDRRRGESPRPSGAAERPVEDETSGEASGQCDGRDDTPQVDPPQAPAVDPDVGADTPRPAVSGKPEDVPESVAESGRQSESEPEPGTTADDHRIRRNTPAPEETADPAVEAWLDGPPSRSGQVLAALVQDALARGASHAHLARVNGEVRLTLRIDGQLCRRRGVGARLDNELADELFARLRSLADADAADRSKGLLDVHLAATHRGEEATLAMRPIAWTDEMVLLPNGLAPARELLADGRGMVCVVGAGVRSRRSLLHALAGGPGDECVSQWEELAHPARCAEATAEASDRPVAVSLPTDSITDALAMLTDAADAGRLAHALRGLAAPFVVRRLCASCAVPGETAPALLERVGIQPEELEKAAAPVGCEWCGWTGYRGRGMLVATVEVDEALRSLLRREQSLGASMLAESRRRVSTRREGLAAVRAGLTTLSELLRAAGRAIEH